MPACASRRCPAKNEFPALMSLWAFWTALVLIVAGWLAAATVHQGIYVHLEP